MTARPLPILYVHHRQELGGAPTSLTYLLRELDRERFQPDVYCPPGPAAEAFREAGATVHEGPVATFTHIWASTYEGRRWLLFARELQRLPNHLYTFRRILRSKPYALVHLNDSPLVPAAWIAYRARIPVVWHLRSALPTTGSRRSRVLRAIIRRLAARTIAINQNVAQSFGVGAEIVPNAVDLERFKPADPASARESLGFPADTHVVSYFGFIYPSKGFREFIEAAGILARDGVEAAYLIVGGGVRGEEFFETHVGRLLERVGLARDYQREATELVQELALSGRVRFVPFTRDTALIYQASDVVVSPSRGPELGRPVLEASACGRVIVASGSVDGAGLVLPGETGYLVPRRSPGTLAAALRQLLEDDELRNRLGAGARRHAEAHFDAARIAGRVMDLYEEVLRP